MLIHLVVVLAVIAIIWVLFRWFVPQMGLPAPLVQIINIILVAVIVIILLMALLPLLGVGTGYHLQL